MLHIPDRIIRSNRKTIALEVGENGILTVRAPHKASTADIKAFLSKHADWINRKRAEAMRRHDEKKIKLAEGVLLKGVIHPILRIKTDDFAIKINDGKILLADDLGDSEALYLTAMFKIKAKAYLRRRTIILARELGFEISAIRITSARRKWGSCNYKLKTVNLNWRLVMAPPEVSDYVIIHELCHLRVPNHSKAFWDLVAGYSPDYKLHKKTLKDDGARYDFD